MKAITVRQPWAWAIIHAGKSPENRPVVYKHTGDVAIHAAKEWDLPALDDPAIAAAFAEHDIDVDRVRAGLEGRRFPISSVIGVVQLCGGHRSAEGCCPDNPWAQRPTDDDVYIGHHKLARPRPLPYPIRNVRGNVVLWNADDDLERQIQIALMEGGAQQ